MAENTQIMMFCLTIIVLIGIISVVICNSRDQIKFKLKAKAKLPDQSGTEFDFEVNKSEEENK